MESGSRPKKPSSGDAVKKSTSSKNKVKKESLPIKRRPLIAESDSEDDFPPPPKKQPALDKTSPVTKPAPSTNGTLQVKQEPPSTPQKVPVANSVKVKKEKAPVDKPAAASPATTAAALVKKEVPVTPPKPVVTQRTPKKKEEKDKSSAKKPKNVDSAKKKVAGVKRRKRSTDDMSEGDDDDDEFRIERPKKARKSSGTPKAKVKGADTPKSRKTPTADKKRKAEGQASTGPAKKKKEEVQEVWEWWKEEPHPDGVKWVSLEHKGPYFAPPYEPLPPSVRFYYDTKPMKLTTKTEEAATFFGKMLDHDYTKKDVFCTNFFEDWRKEMTAEEAAAITDFSKCDFTEIHQFFKERSEAKKQMSKEEKQKIKQENEAVVAEYGWATIDGHKEKIGNFKIEPPGLFRGRGDHPKQGRIKRRVLPEDVTINVSKDARVPEPPPGHKWKQVQHDSKVTWLASWTENIQGQIKYIMLNPTSRLKGEKDWAKYETARKLKNCVDRIRAQYREDLHSKEMRIRQRAVALYFIDKLALRAGHEKDADETADTVGCCSLRVEHISLHEELDGKKDVVVFDFLGKDSIRYYNSVPVDHQVFKNVRLFMKGKEPGDDLFDRLNTTMLNKHLNELMEGLTAKVFRTYNASVTLQQQLEELTTEDDNVPQKMLSYNRANRAVAILCNHQRAPPKTFDKQMSNLQSKIEAKEEGILDVKKEVKLLKKELKSGSDPKLQKKLEMKKKQLSRLEEQRSKLELQATDKEENKEIALGTSKLNYLDPRISVSWCKKHEVPVEKVYNRSQRDKFAWAIDMADETFEF